MSDFMCPLDHVTEHLHMGVEADAPIEIPCEGEGCKLSASRALHANFYNEVRRGNADFSERAKARLRKRNDEYMRGEGKDEVIEARRRVRA